MNKEWNLQEKPTHMDRFLGAMFYAASIITTIIVIWVLAILFLSMGV